MPYVRPANPVEVNPDNTLMPNGKFYLLGSNSPRDDSGNHWPGIGRNPDSGWLRQVGDWNNIAVGPDFVTVAPNPSNSSLQADYSPGFNEPLFRRVIVFDVANVNTVQRIYQSTKDDTGGGYIAGSLTILTYEGTLVFERSNQANLGNIPGLVVGTNVLAFGTGPGDALMGSLNGGDTVNLTNSAFGIGPAGEMFGQHQYRGEDSNGITLRFYGWSQGAADAASLKSLSTTPMQVVRTVGSTGGGGEPPPAADTDPPGLITLGSNADGSIIYLSADETLKNQSNLASLTMTGGHTVTGITIDGGIASVTINPPLALGEAQQTMSYVASASGFVDLAGNQLPSFANQVVANNTGAGFWKFLGNEGQTVSVPAGTRVRYGITGAYVEKTMSGTFVITNDEFTDPAPGSIKHAESFVNGVATGYDFYGPATGPVGESAQFTVSVNGLVNGDLVVTPSAAGLTFSPASVAVNNAAMTATFTAIATAPGDFSITLANNKNFTNPPAFAYKALTSIFKTFGTGGDYPDLTSAIVGVGQTSPGDARVMVVLEGLSNQANVNGTINPSTANESFYYLIRPKKETQFGELNRGGSLHESMPGARLAITSGRFEIGGGVMIDDYIIDITAADGFKFGSGGAGMDAKFRRCFILANADRAMQNQAYKSSALEDCFIIRTSAHTGKMFNATWVLKIDRCTWYSKNGLNYVAHDGGWGNGAYIKDSAYVGFGPNPIEQLDGFGKSNNVSTSTLSNTQGFTVDTTRAAFKSATNYRAGPALVGKAGASARSINDILGNNRGLNPDAGAAQDVAAMALPVGTMTSQPDPDGARVSGFFSYTGVVTRATVTLEAIADGLTVGPIPVTFGNGTGSYQVEDNIPGTYKAPNIQLGNEGGDAQVSGAVPYEIVGPGGSSVDPGVQSAADAVVWSGPGGGAAGVESTPFNVGLNGSYSGVVRVTPSDANGSGAFNPAYVDLVNGGTASFTYTPATGGTKSLSVLNDKGLQNPNPMNYVVTVPQVIVPKVVLPLTTDGTTAVAAMSGLEYSWFDQSKPSNFTAPKLKGNNGVIANGAFELILEGSALIAGQTGYLVLTNTNGDVAQNPAALVFSGSVKVQ